MLNQRQGLQHSMRRTARNLLDGPAEGDLPDPLLWFNSQNGILADYFLDGPYVTYLTKPKAKGKYHMQGAPQMKGKSQQSHNKIDFIENFIKEQYLPRELLAEEIANAQKEGIFNKQYKNSLTVKIDHANKQAIGLSLSYQNGHQKKIKNINIVLTLKEEKVTGIDIKRMANVDFPFYNIYQSFRHQDIVYHRTFNKIVRQEGENHKVFMETDKHFMDFIIQNNQLLSLSSDNTIEIVNMEDGIGTAMQQSHLKSFLISISSSYHPQLYHLVSYQQQYYFDLRESSSIQQCPQNQQQANFEIKHISHQYYQISHDKSICIYDTRNMGQPIIEVPHHMEEQPLSVSVFPQDLFLAMNGFSDCNLLCEPHQVYSFAPYALGGLMNYSFDRSALNTACISAQLINKCNGVPLNQHIAPDMRPTRLYSANFIDNRSAIRGVQVLSLYDSDLVFTVDNQGALYLQILKVSPQGKQHVPFTNPKYSKEQVQQFIWKEIEQSHKQAMKPNNEQDSSDSDELSETEFTYKNEKDLKKLFNRLIEQPDIPQNFIIKNQADTVVSTQVPQEDIESFILNQDFTKETSNYDHKNSTKNLSNKEFLITNDIINYLQQQ